MPGTQKLHKRPIFSSCLLLLIFIFTTNVFASEHDFPLRAKYPQSPYISTDDLKAELNDCLVFDVRSEFEYKVIHIKDSIHVPIASTLFTQILKKNQAKNPGKKIVFYCNGHTCAKSYKAEVKARKAGIKSYAMIAAFLTGPQSTLDLPYSSVNLRPTRVKSSAKMPLRQRIFLWSNFPSNPRPPMPFSLMCAMQFSASKLRIGPKNRAG